MQQSHLGSGKRRVAALRMAEYCFGYSKGALSCRHISQKPQLRNLRDADCRHCRRVKTRSASKTGWVCHHQEKGFLIQRFLYWNTVLIQRVILHLARRNGLGSTSPLSYVSILARKRGCGPSGSYKLRAHHGLLYTCCSYRQSHIA